MKNTILFKNGEIFRRILLSYIAKNRIGTALGVYVIVGLFLKIGFQTNIFIPCLWSRIFGIRCPGCGLTRASVQLLSFNFAAAFETNPLTFVILPAMAFYIAQDFLKHVKRTFKN